MPHGGGALSQERNPSRLTQRSAALTNTMFANVKALNNIVDGGPGIYSHSDKKFKVMPNELEVADTLLID